MGGNSFSSEPQHTEQPKVNHPKFKDSKLITDNDVIRSTITIEHQSDFQLWQQKLNKTSNIDDEVILLPKAFRYEKKAICGSSCTIQIDYDNYPYILADELENRRQVKKYFTEPQIWYLLYSLVSAAHDFQKLGERVGDIRPQNIFINQQGHIKVSNLFSWPGETSNYNKTIYDHQKTYISPQQAEEARQGKSQTLIDKYQAQSFTIGLTTLQTALIKKLNYLYLPNKSFDLQNFQKTVIQWWTFTFQVVDQENQKKTTSRYSDLLKLVVANLCQIKPKQRLTSQQVYNWLKGFHKQINQLKPFTIKNLPPIKNTTKYQNFIEKMQNLKLNQDETKVNTANQYQKDYFYKYANGNVNQGNFNQTQIQTQSQPNYSQFTNKIPSQPQPQQTYQNANYNNLQNTKNQTRPFQLQPEDVYHQKFVQYSNYNFSTNPTNTVPRVASSQQNQTATTFEGMNPTQVHLHHIHANKKHPPTTVTPTPIQNTGYFSSSNNQQFILNQPNYSNRLFQNNQNNTYSGLTGSETRSNQFLRQIDQKLNALKKQAL